MEGTDDGGAQRNHEIRGGHPVAIVTDVERFIDEELSLTEAQACAQQENPGWTDAESQEAVRRYRDFLWVCYTCDRKGQPKLAEVDLRVDQIWHCHMKQDSYPADCARIFGQGRILKHSPIGTEDDVVGAVELAELAYAAAGRPFPTEYQRAKCVWGVTHP